MEQTKYNVLREYFKQKEAGQNPDFNQMWAFQTKRPVEKSVLGGIEPGAEPGFLQSAQNWFMGKSGEEKSKRMESYFETLSNNAIKNLTTYSERERWDMMMEKGRKDWGAAEWDAFIQRRFQKPTEETGAETDTTGVNKWQQYRRQ
jgi:hypothetical protein